MKKNPERIFIHDLMIQIHLVKCQLFSDRFGK